MGTDCSGLENGMPRADAHVGAQVGVQDTPTGDWPSHDCPFCRPDREFRHLQRCQFCQLVLGSGDDGEKWRHFCLPPCSTGAETKVPQCTPARRQPRLEHILFRQPGLTTRRRPPVRPGRDDMAIGEWARQHQPIWKCLGGSTTSDCSPRVRGSGDRLKWENAIYNATQSEVKESETGSDAVGSGTDWAGGRLAGKQEIKEDRSDEWAFCPIFFSPPSLQTIVKKCPPSVTGGLKSSEEDTSL
ncbi:unnamed protein product [Protopolystoma xenopodis]|uniref:Uncharacterized protein n=1 Tax=Protopolystoma xenopodis TaxID=117903 RepID=A0A3S5CCU2_9PLAT|nr:unnamed protein product [Protopolystoma xenopodis]